jgi:NADH:ubiquinone reductase (H+-translocating)
MPSADCPEIVILGGGFAGCSVAQELERLLPSEGECHVTLVDQNNFFLFTPMLTEVAGGEIDRGDIVAAIRSLAPRITFEQGRVETIDAAHRRVTIAIGDAAAGIPEVQRVLSADHLVIALGAVTNFHHIDGLKHHALPIKSVQDAEAIRDRAVMLLERADGEPDRDLRRELLTFVVGGGGFSGVETMAALNDMVRGLVHWFPRVDPTDVRTIIIQPGSRLLPEISPRLASYAQRELQRRGVEVVLNTLVTDAGPDFVEVKEQGDGASHRIPARTVIWAGGVKPSPAIDTSGLDLGRHGGIVVDRCCRVPGYPGIWALGDCAEVPQPGGGGDDSTYAPTAQNATREGAQVARNIVAADRGEQPRPFDYHPIGELAVVGRRAAVASIYGFEFSGIAAWAMWRAIYLAKLPRWQERVRVGFDWFLDLVSSPETAMPAGTDRR